MKDFVKAITYTGVFLVPFVVLIISNSLFFPFITGKNFAFRVIVEIVFASWIILALYDAQYRPKFSWILASFLGLLGVMAIANAFGQYPLQSFWSNFERMEGYVTLVYVCMYIIVLGSVMNSRVLWHRYFNTIIGVALMLTIYAFAQLSGNIKINQGGWRLDGTLGNSAYMAVYMLFLIFFTTYMTLHTKGKGLRYTYGAIVLLFVYLLIQTATRGTILGLVGGSLVSVFYIALFAKQNPTMRRVASGGLIALVLVVGLFVAFKDSSFVQGNRYLQRVANISLSEAQNRFNIWSMAFEGVKERPILGWGQSNYSYVFNQYFRPELHGQEAWFDRVHNIVMDWLIAGGVLGLVAYFSVMASAVYYLAIRPLRRKEDSAFTVVERGLLLGILVGYLIHNMVVFDNIVSYIFYAVVLAFIHARVARPLVVVEKKYIDPRLIEQIVAPMVAVACVVVVYMVNVPNIQAAGDVIRAFSTNDPEKMLMYFDTALSRNTFGKQEIREQFTQRGQTVIQDEKVPKAVKDKIQKRIEEELIKQNEEKPGDARSYVFIASFYRSTNQLDKAAEQMAIARALSPRKQVIIFEQGFVEIMRQDYEKALAFFKEAYDLGPDLRDVRTNYASAALYAGKQELFDELIQTKEQKRDFARDQFAIQAAYQNKKYDLLVEMLLIQIEDKPDDQQLRTSLAYIYNEMGKKDEAIAVLKKASEDIPAYKKQADDFIAALGAEAKVMVK